jgi:hypothetical protein
MFWKVLVFPPLRGAQVFGVLDNTNIAPPKTFEVEAAEKKRVVNSA